MISPTSVDTGVATEARCYVGETCEIALHARDFGMDSSRAENGGLRLDVVRIELAIGVATHADSDLKHMSGSACRGDGAVNCILNLTNVGKNMNVRTSWIGHIVCPVDV